jgi:hypothetical protein
MIHIVTVNTSPTALTVLSLQWMKSVFPVEVGMELLSVMQMNSVLQNLIGFLVNFLYAFYASPFQAVRYTVIKLRGMFNCKGWFTWKQEQVYSSMKYMNCQA